MKYLYKCLLIWRFCWWKWTLTCFLFVNVVNYVVFGGYFYTNNKENLIEFWVICPFLEQIHFLLLYTLTPDNWFESFSYYLHCRSHDAPESKSHINLFYWQLNKNQNIYCSTFLQLSTFNFRYFNFHQSNIVTWYLYFYSSITCEYFIQHCTSATLNEGTIN